MDHAQITGAEIARMAAVVDRRDLSLPVPTCPGWTLADLIRHTGGVHRWVTAMVGDLAQRSYRRRDMDMGLPADEADLPEWLASGADPLVEALRRHSPAEPMWTWASDRTVGWWARRQVHETIVHRADAELALGLPPVIDQLVAADGVTEFLDVLPDVTWNPRHAELKGDGEVIEWRTWSGKHWSVRLTPDGYTKSTDEDADVTMWTEDAAELMLVLWRRLPVTGKIDGDVKLLQWWSERSAI